jgi:hypothetical protein
MKTKEGNKLIAEFMETRSAIIDDMYFGENGMLYTEENLRYHFEWNWLMPVVQKIETLGFRVNITGITCSVSRILETETIIQLVLGEVSMKINLVWAVCVDFIEWYNKTK